MISVKGYVCGWVQGVGFRYFASRQALAENLRGYARNLADGRVEFLLQGDADAVARVVAELHRGPRFAQVTRVDYAEVKDVPRLTDFSTR